MPIYSNKIREKAYIALAEKYPFIYNDGMYQNVKREAKRLYSMHQHKAYLFPYFDKIKGKTIYKQGKTANPTKFICEDMTRLSFGEKAEIKITNNDTIDKYFQDVFKNTNFINHLKDLTERSFYAIGGMSAMPYISGDTGNEKLMYDWIDADLYIPLTYTKESIMESAYVKLGKKLGSYYMLIVSNEIKDGRLVISHELYVYNTKKEQFKKEKLESLFPEIEPSQPIDELNEQIIVYGKNAKANSIDFDTPEGLPFTANAEDLIFEYNYNVDNIFSELKGSKQRVAYPQDWQQEIRGTNNGSLHRGIDIYEDEVLLAPMGSIDADNSIQYNAGVLRATEIMAMGQGLATMISIQLGLDAGYYSFTIDGGITATEVISKRSKTFIEKRNEEHNIEKFVSDLVKTSIRVLQAEGIQFTDIDEATLNELEIKFIADDSIITDDNAQREEARAEYRMGLRSRESYLTEQRKLTPQEALEEAEKIDEEKRAAQESFFGFENEEDLEEDDNE